MLCSTRYADEIYPANGGSKSRALASFASSSYPFSLSVSTTVLDFGGSLSNMLLAIGNTGRGDLQITQVTASESWILDAAHEDDVFTDAPDLLWSRVLQRKGGEYERLSRVPYDPTMN